MRGIRHREHGQMMSSHAKGLLLHSTSPPQEGALTKCLLISEGYVLMAQHKRALHLSLNSSASPRQGAAPSHDKGASCAAKGDQACPSHRDLSKLLLQSICCIAILFGGVVSLPDANGPVLRARRIACPSRGKPDGVNGAVVPCASHVDTLQIQLPRSCSAARETQAPYQ